MAVATERSAVIELLNETLSAEYHSFVGHALNSNPFIPPSCEKDVETLEAVRDDENSNARALLVQLGRYRAGPTLTAFRYWKEDLNFLGIDWLVIRAAEIAKSDVARIEAAIKRIPSSDEELLATFTSILGVKRKHAADLGVLAAKRQKERDGRRAAAVKVTAIPIKKPAAAKPAAAAATPAAAPAAGGAPKAPAMPGAPKLPGAPKAPPMPGAPKPPSPPLPGGGPKPPSPPLPPGAPKPPSAPKPPGAPNPPKPPAPKAAPADAAEPITTEAMSPPPAADDGPKLAGPPGPDYKPTPPKPYVRKDKQ